MCDYYSFTAIIYKPLVLFITDETEEDCLDDSDDTGNHAEVETRVVQRPKPMLNRMTSLMSLDSRMAKMNQGSNKANADAKADPTMRRRSSCPSTVDIIDGALMLTFDQSPR